MEKLRHIIREEVGQELKEPVDVEACLALVIRDLRGRVLLVQENHSSPKHERKRGQWSIVTETCSPEDNSLFEVLTAGLLEEVSGDIKNFRLVIGTYKKDILACNGDPENVYTRHSALVVYEGEEKEADFYPSDPGEISGYKWVFFEELRQMWQRGEVEKDVFPLVSFYKHQDCLNPVE